MTCQTVFAFLLNQTLSSYHLTENIDVDNEADMEKRRRIFELFGTFTRSIFTMFEITLGNFVPVARVLIEDVHPALMLFSLMHKLLFGYAVINVVNSIFVQETFKVAACDDTIMTMQKERAEQIHVKKMSLFF